MPKWLLAITVAALLFLPHAAAKADAELVVAALDAPADVRAGADCLGDGVDDSAAIQACEAQLLSQGGGTLRLSQGTFLIGQPVGIYGVPQTIIGDGPATRLIRTMPGTIWQSNGRSDLMIADMSLEGLAGQGSGVLLVNGQRLQIANVVVTGFYRGISIMASSAVTVTNSETRDNAYAGVFIWDSANVLVNNHHSDGDANNGLSGALALGGTSHDAKVKASVVVNSGGTGILAYRSGGNHLIEGNYIYHPALHGIGVEEGEHDTTVSHNVLDGGQRTAHAMGISLWHTGVNNNIHHNRITGFDRPINIEGALGQGGEIHQNTISGAGGTGMNWDGVVLYNASGFYVHHNRITDSRRHGVYIYGNLAEQPSLGNVVRGNTIYGSGGYGVAEAGQSDYSMVARNDIRGNALGGVSLVGAHSEMQDNHE